MFLGLGRYCRRSIGKFSGIVSILQAATSNHEEFKVTDDMSTTFQDLEEKLHSPPVLRFPDFEAPFLTEMDASSVGVRVILSQKNGEKMVNPFHFSMRNMNEDYRI